METNRATLKILLTSILMIVLVEFTASGLFDFLNLSDNLMRVGLLRVIEIGFMLGMAFYFTQGLAVIGLSEAGLMPGIAVGWTWSLGFGVITGGIAAALFFSGHNPIDLVVMKLPEDKTGLVLLFIVGGLIGPVAEEIFFRGICYGYFRRLGILSAIIITTGIFVVAHSIQHTVPVPQIVGGVVFALSYEKSKSLMSPIIIHVAGNLAIFFISFFAN